MRVLVAAAALLSMMTLGARAGGFALSSPDVPDGGRLSAIHVFSGAGCAGGNQSPALSWQGVPEGTKSLALTVFDPDAKPSGWWHWVLYDLPPSSFGLPADAGRAGSPILPAAARQGVNDFATTGYGGPCPPPGGPHRYVFTLYALDVGHLGLDDGASGAMLKADLGGHVLGTASLTALYGR